MAWTSQLNNFIARVVTLIGSVSSIATKQVHDGIRDLYDPATWEQHFWDNTHDLFSGWMVDRNTSVSIPQEGTTRSLVQRNHAIKVVGWLELDDPQTGQQILSAPMWRKLVEDICTAIREDIRTDTPLNNAYCGGGSMPSVTVDEHRDIPLGRSADGTEDDVEITRCHYCEIEFTVIERIVWT